MGSDIAPISKHNLDTSSLASLAADISKRLEVNIDFGYSNIFNLGKHYHPASHDGFNILGRVEHHPDAAEYKLCEDAFLEKELYKKYGRDFFKSDAYLKEFYEERTTDHNIDELLKSHEILYVDLRCKKDVYSDITIYNECLNCELYYYSRWWGFCDNIMNKEVDDSMEEYLANMRRTTQLLGADKIYYVNDQSNILMGVGQSGEGGMTWAELELFIHEKVGKYLIDIPAYMTDYMYYEISRIYDHELLSFVDTFKDLK